VEAPPPEFNPKDLNETFRWAYKRAKYFRDNEDKAQAAVSQNALNDEDWRKFLGEVDAFRDELNRHKGETVAWKATVREITGKGVEVGCSFDQKFDPSLYRPFLGLSLYVKFIEDDKFDEYGYLSESVLPLDIAISRDFAKTLKPGDVVTVEGTLAKIDFRGLYKNKYHNTLLNIYVINAKAGKLVMK